MSKNISVEKYMKKVHKNLEELQAIQEKRYKETMDLIESIQGLEPITKSTEWLRFVSNDILDFSDQEALIYIASRGLDYSNALEKLLYKWRESKKRSIERHFATSITVVNSNTGKSRTKKPKISPDLYKFLENTQPDFWYGRSYDDYFIDATMLRTVEWCGIGGFEEYWVRNARRQYEAIVSSGIDSIPASFYVFNMCRSEYGVQLNNKALNLMLDAIEISDAVDENPWLRHSWRINPPKLVENFAYAASIVFANEVLRPSTGNNELIENALNSLLKHQETNGAWRYWATGEHLSIETTAMVVHALAAKKPRGWELATSKAKEWLLTMQDRAGYWHDEGGSDVVYLTVLVLDAIELASEGTNTTLKNFQKRKTSKKQKAVNKKEGNTKNLIHNEVIMGNKYVGGDNNSGIQYVGNFHNVVTSLKNAGRSDIADALLTTREAILNSKNLSDDKKKEHLEVLDTIGNEISKPQPNKTLIKMLGDGFLAALKVVPDLIKVAAALAPYLTELAK